MRCAGPAEGQRRCGYGVRPPAGSRPPNGKLLGRPARARVLQLFTTDHCFGTYRSLYDQLRTGQPEVIELTEEEGVALARLSWPKAGWEMTLITAGYWREARPPPVRHVHRSGRRPWPSVRRGRHFLDASPVEEVSPWRVKYGRHFAESPPTDRPRSDWSRAGLSTPTSPSPTRPLPTRPLPTRPVLTSP